MIEKKSNQFFCIKLNINEIIISMNRTIKYFLEITKIYRESKYEDKMSEYLINFAKKRGLKYIKDKCGNVLITKTVDEKLPIILQAHLDMIYI